VQTKAKASGSGALPDGSTIMRRRPQFPKAELRELGRRLYAEWLRTGRDVKVFPIKLKVSSWGQLENWAQEFFERSAVIPGYLPKKHGFETWVNNLYFYELHQIYPPYDEFWLERLSKANYDPFWWRKAAPILLAQGVDPYEAASLELFAALRCDVGKIDDVRWMVKPEDGCLWVTRRFQINIDGLREPTHFERCGCPVLRIENTDVMQPDYKEVILPYCEEHTKTAGRYYSIQSDLEWNEGRKTRLTVFVEALNKRY
jgi:hypothetical protein